MKALIIGADGQDGKLLTSFLKDKQYELRLIDLNCMLNIEDSEAVKEYIQKELPDEIYYLAAYHHSAEEEKPDNISLFSKSLNINLLCLVNFLEAVSLYSQKTRVFYAASSHIFGVPDNSMQDENTPINPENIYGISKAAGLFTCRFYRRNYNIFVSVGILYNHESSMRRETFLSKKVSKGVADIKNGKRNNLELNSLDDSIDFGYAPDYVEAMWKILSVEQADDFIIASGENHKIEEFVQLAFKEVGLDYKKFVNVKDNTRDDHRSVLVGSIKKLNSRTGWKPRTSFEEMINILVTNELNQ